MGDEIYDMTVLVNGGDAMLDVCTGQYERCNLSGLCWSIWQIQNGRTVLANIDKKYNMKGLCVSATY